MYVCTLLCNVLRRHVLSVHSSASRPQSIARGAAAGAAATGTAAAGSSDVVREGEPPIDEKLLKRFIHYARTHCFPRLEEASAGRLVAKFVELRDKVRLGILGVIVAFSSMCVVVRHCAEQHDPLTAHAVGCGSTRQQHGAAHAESSSFVGACRRVRRVLPQTPVRSALFP